MRKIRFAAWTTLATLSALFLVSGFSGPALADDTVQQASSTVAIRPIAPIGPLAFVPPIITPSPDGLVTFVNTDAVITHQPHDTTSGGACFDFLMGPGGLGPALTVRTVSVVGCATEADGVTINYFCAIHNGMTGSITV